MFGRRMRAFAAALAVRAITVRTITVRTIAGGTMSPAMSIVAAVAVTVATTTGPRTALEATDALLALGIVAGLAFGLGADRRRNRHVLVGRHRLDRDALVDQALDALELAALAAVAERESHARGAGARGAAD